MGRAAEATEAALPPGPPVVACRRYRLCHSEITALLSIAQFLKSASPPPHSRAILALLLLPAAFANLQFTPRPLTSHSVPHRKGECDIALWVDDAVEVTLHGGRADVRTIAGADARDDGSECSGPLPEREVEGFEFQVKQKRGQIDLAEPPSSRNGFRAVMFIRDSAPGEGLYRFRISWKLPQPRPPAGMSLNNAIHSAAAGHGEATIEGRTPLLLTAATVDYDRAGKIFVVFSPPKGEAISFTGSVTSIEGNVLKADSEADERLDHLRGPMYIYFDPRQRVYKIELHATNGQSRLTLHWEKGK